MDRLMKVTRLERIRVSLESVFSLLVSLSTFYYDLESCKRKIELGRRRVKR